MSIDLVNSGDGWFNRQGSIVGEFNRVAALYGSATDVGFQSIWSLFATSDQAAVTALPDAVTSFRTTDTTYCSVLTTAAQAASVLQVNRAIPPTSNTFVQSVQRVRQQMIDTSQSINRPALGSTVTLGSGNAGNTKLFVSTVNIYGDPLDTTFEETLTAVCTSQGSGFNSAWSVTGEPLISPPQWNWPGGSGAQASLSTNDPAIDGIVSNSALTLFTVANTPDDWTIVDGSAGSTILNSVGGNVRSGYNAVSFVSDGALATKLSQSVSLTANVVYAVTFQAKMNANSASGTLVVQLYNPTTAAVLDNDAGDALQVTYNLNGGAGELTTSYQLLTVFFSTPRQLPSDVQLRIGYGTAAVSTRQMTVCNVQVFQATPLYGASGTGTSGPFACTVGNTTYSAVGDTAEIEFTNSLGTQSFVWGLERLNGFRALGLYLPSDGSPTISDSLVTH